MQVVTVIAYRDINSSHPGARVRINIEDIARPCFSMDKSSSHVNEEALRELEGSNEIERVISLEDRKAIDQALAYLNAIALLDAASMDARS